MGEGRVLVVDDNKLIRMLAVACLRPLGCDVREAVDGEDALAAIQEFVPDVVLLDVIMPKLDGFEVLARVRQDPGTHVCRIVMLTTADTASDHERARIDHADAYITKPFDHAQLRETVRSLLEGRSA